MRRRLLYLEHDIVGVEEVARLSARVDAGGDLVGRRNEPHREIDKTLILALDVIHRDAQMCRARIVDVGISS